MKINALAARPLPRPSSPRSNDLPHDVVLIGEMRGLERSITRNQVLALCGSALVCTSAVLASGQQSGLLAAAIGVPLGLLAGCLAGKWMNSEGRVRLGEIEEQLRR